MNPPASDGLSSLEFLARRAAFWTDAEDSSATGTHPFDDRRIHQTIPAVVRRLFDDGHYAQATFEAFKHIEAEVRRHSGLQGTGQALMMEAFDSSKPHIGLTACSSVSEVDEQEGFRFMFAGAVRGIRNPRGHEVGLADGPDDCLDHLAFASMLLRRLEAAGYR